MIEYIKIIILAFIVYFLFKGVNRVINKMPFGKRSKQSLLRIVPLFELLLWSFVIYLFITEVYSNFLFEHNHIAIIYLVAFLLLVGWYVIRDFVCGVVLRSENGFEIGSIIISDTVKGEISRTGNRSLTIINGQGESLKIPYSLLIGSSIIRPSSNRNRKEFKFEYKTESTIGADRLRSIIYQKLIESPWVIYPESASVELKRDGENKYIVYVKFNSVNSQTALKVEEELGIQ